MARKSKIVKEDTDRERARIEADLEKSKRRIQEIEEQLRLVEEEEMRMVENAEKKINEACKEASVFCGVILSPADLGNVIALAVQTGGNVKIPFKLYFNE